MHAQKVTRNLLIHASGTTVRISDWSLGKNGIIRLWKTMVISDNYSLENNEDK